MLPNKALILPVLFSCSICAAPQTAQPREVSPDAFKNPPFVYRPIATLSDHGVSADVMDEVKKVFLERGYGGVLFSPSPGQAPAQRALPPANGLPPAGGAGTGRRPMALQYAYPPEASQWLPKALPGEAGIGSYMVPPKPDASAALKQFAVEQKFVPDPTLGYMTDAYFAKVKEILAFAKEYGRKATYYDEVGFPSGMADHTTPAKYFRKTLERQEAAVSSGAEYKSSMPADGTVVAIVAMNAAGGQRLDLLPMVKEGQLAWTAPPGDWKVDTFVVKAAKSSGRAVDYNGAVDYMDPEAVGWFIEHAYQPMADHVRSYFGNTLNMTFFDDVGIYSDDRTWSNQLNAKFKAMTGKDAGIYYPALWGDIGPDTVAARVGFFGARASLLGEGFPKLVSEWDDRHGLQASGHTPGNYDLQPVDMNGDPFKFYRYSIIPMVDVIFGHGFGRGGYKLISSAADEQDKPLVVAEAFSAGGDPMGYRRLIELYVRGVNRFVTSASPRQEPVGAPTDFAEWAGRNSLLLQGGRHVADIAILYPIESLEAHYYFDAKENSKSIPVGMFISKDTDYQAVGEMLLNQAHRDFSFLHPDTLRSAKVTVTSGSLVLNNKVNRQTYKVLILPGAKVMSVQALKKVKAFYDAGGTVVATSLLASKAAEFGQDETLRTIVKAVFAIDPSQPMPDGVSPVHKNAKGGKAVFMRKPSAELLDQTLDSLAVSRDVAFENNPQPTTGNGCFSYIHKVKDGDEIFFFGNSSDTPVSTQVKLRGNLTPELWDPKTGVATSIPSVRHIEQKGLVYTQVPLDISQLSSLFIVSRSPASTPKK